VSESETKRRYTRFNTLSGVMSEWGVPISEALRQGSHFNFAAVASRWQRVKHFIK